jgi:hypothetical protein
MVKVAFQLISSAQNRPAFAELQWGCGWLLRFRCKATILPAGMARAAPAYL